MKTERCILHRGDIKRDLVIDNQKLLTKLELHKLHEYLRVYYEYEIKAKVISNRNYSKVGDGINAFINKIIIVQKTSTYDGKHIFFYNNLHELVKCELSDNLYLNDIVTSNDMQVFVSSTGVLFLYNSQFIFATIDLNSGSFYNIKDITKEEYTIIDRIDEVDGQLYLYYDVEYSDEDVSKLSISTVFNLWSGYSSKLELKFANDGINQIRVCEKAEQIAIKMDEVLIKESSLKIASKDFLKKLKLELLKSYKKIKSVAINEIFQYSASGNDYVSDNINGYIKNIYSIAGEYKLSYSWFGHFSCTVLEDRFGNLYIGKINEKLFDYSESIIVSNEGVICFYNDYSIKFTLDGRIVCKCNLSDCVKNSENEEYTLSLRDDGLYYLSDKIKYKITFSFDFFNTHSQIVIPEFNIVESEEKK